MMMMMDDEKGTMTMLAAHMLIRMTSPPWISLRKHTEGKSFKNFE